MASDVSRVSRIVAIAEPIAAEHGLEVLDVEISGSGSSPLVRVLLDSPQESRPIGIDDCRAISERLGDGLDAYDVLHGRYMLEVSSPGLNRPLKRPEHFQRVLGRKVRVRTKHAAVDGRRTWLGRLEEADDAGVTVADESGVTARIALGDIERANLEFEFESGGAKKKKKR
ncbi:MAG TPA: ribosome maturation factor RimP [Candidatus Binatia bacterium]|jgi:ribosome maturation factor RimP